MEKFRVLIVDDEEDFVGTMVKRLKAHGLDAEGVTSGQKALALLEGTTFDVCVLDVKMPGMDGIEALEKMKKNNASIEVILVTGHGSPDCGVRGLQLGAYDFLMKPVPFPLLLDKLVQAYGRKLVEQQRLQTGSAS